MNSSDVLCNICNIGWMYHTPISIYECMNTMVSKYSMYWWCCCASMFTYRLKQKQLLSTTYNLLERKQVSSYLWKNVLFTACYTYCVDSRISYSVKKLSRESKNKWVVCKMHHDYRRQSCGSDSIQLFDPLKCTCWELQVSTPCLLRI